MNNTQLAAEIAALRERLNDLERNARRFAYLYVDHQHGNMRSNLGYHDIAEGDQLAFERWVFNADALSNDWVTPIPEPPTPAPDDVAKWKAVTNTLVDYCRKETGHQLVRYRSRQGVRLVMAEAFQQGLAIDPERLVVTDAMVEQVYQDLIAADDNVRYNAKRCVAFVLEAALAAVKGDSNGK